MFKAIKEFKSSAEQWAIDFAETDEKAIQMKEDYERQVYEHLIKSECETEKEIEKFMKSDRVLLQMKKNFEEEIAKYIASQFLNQFHLKD